MKIDLNEDITIHDRDRLKSDLNKLHLYFLNPGNIIKGYDSYVNQSFNSEQNTLKPFKLKTRDEDENQYKLSMKKFGADFIKQDIKAKDTSGDDLAAKKEIQKLTVHLSQFANQHFTKFECYISVLFFQYDDTLPLTDDGALHFQKVPMYIIALSPDKLESPSSEPEFDGTESQENYRHPSKDVLASSHILYKTKHNDFDFFAYDQEDSNYHDSPGDKEEMVYIRKAIRATDIEKFTFDNSHTAPSNYEFNDFSSESKLHNWSLNLGLHQQAIKNLLEEPIVKGLQRYEETTFTNSVYGVLNNVVSHSNFKDDLYIYSFFSTDGQGCILLFLSSEKLLDLEDVKHSGNLADYRTIYARIISILNIQLHLRRPDFSQNDIINMAASYDDDVDDDDDDVDDDDDDDDDDVDDDDDDDVEEEEEERMVIAQLGAYDNNPCKAISVVGIPLDLEQKSNQSKVFTTQTLPSLDIEPIHEYADAMKPFKRWYPLTLQKKVFPGHSDEAEEHRDRFAFMLDHCGAMVRDLFEINYYVTKYSLPVDRRLSGSLMNLNSLMSYVSCLLDDRIKTKETRYCVKPCFFEINGKEELCLIFSLQKNIPFNKVLTTENITSPLILLNIRTTDYFQIQPNKPIDEPMDGASPTSGADLPDCGKEGVTVIPPPKPDNELMYLSNMRDELHDDMSSGYFKRQQGDMPLLLTKENRKRAADTDLESLPAYKKMRPNLTLAATGGIGLVGIGAGLGGVFGIAEHIRNRKAGTDGTSGNAGGKGQIGATSVGARGLSGDKGNDGDRAEKGDAGQRGQQGQQGQSGTDGRAGQEGDTGQQGSRGNRGQNGQDGQDGAQGNAGEKGIEGKTGAQGNQGPGGEKGQRGSAGTRGLPGTQTSVDNSTSSGGLGIAAVGVAAAAGAAGIATLASSTAANGLATAAAGAALDAGADRMMGSVGSGHHSTSNKLTPEGTAPADHRSLSAPSHGFSDDLSTHTGALAEPSKQSPDTGLSATNQQNQQPHPAASAYEPTIDTADWDTTMTDGTSDWDYRDPFAADQMASAAPAAASVAGATVAGSALRSMAQSLTGSGKQQGVPQAATGDNTDQTDATHNRSTTNTVTGATAQSSTAQETPLTASLPADLGGGRHGTVGTLNNGGITGQKQRYCVPRTGTQPRRMGFSMTHRHQVFAKKRNTHRYATPCSSKRFTVPRVLHSADNKES